MVESSVGGNPARSGAEIAGRVEARSRFVDAPECFHSQILSNSAVANDADSPRVNFLLVLSKQRLEGFQVARRETLQQLHLPLSVPNYWFVRLLVTVFSTSRSILFLRKFKLATGTRKYTEKGRAGHRVWAYWLMLNLG